MTALAMETAPTIDSTTPSVTRVTEPATGTPPAMTQQDLFNAFLDAGHDGAAVGGLFRKLTAVADKAAEAVSRDPQIVERVRTQLARNAKAADCLASASIPGGAIHDTLDAVMKDDALPTAGSLHAAANEFFLGQHPALAGCTLVHSFSRECVVRVVPLGR